MAEWSIAAVLKTVDPKGSGGSNPSLSAIQGQITVQSLGRTFRASAAPHRTSAASRCRSGSRRPASTATPSICHCEAVAMNTLLKEPSAPIAYPLTPGAVFSQMRVAQREIRCHQRKSHPFSSRKHSHGRLCETQQPWPRSLSPNAPCERPYIRPAATNLTRCGELSATPYPFAENRASKQCETDLLCNVWGVHLGEDLRNLLAQFRRKPLADLI